MPGPRPVLRDRAGVVLFVQAAVPLITREGFVTRQVGPQLFEAPFPLKTPLFFLPANPRNSFPSLLSLDALGGIGMGTGTGMGRRQVRVKELEERQAFVLISKTF